MCSFIYKSQGQMYANYFVDTSIILDKCLVIQSSARGKHMHSYIQIGVQNRQNLRIRMVIFWLKLAPFAAQFTGSRSTVCLLLCRDFEKLKEKMPCYRSCRPQVFCIKGVLRNFIKFTGKHLCQSLFFNKVAGLTLFKKSLWHWCFPGNFV